MAKESLIRKKAVEILKKEGWIVWWPSKAIFKQNDIFGAFDMVCWQKKTGVLKFIQLTTLPNLSTRIKKIKKILKENRLSKQNSASIETWGWNKRKKEFKIELI